jgi:cytochrome b
MSVSDIRASGGAVAPPVWDPVVRISHWAIAVAVVVNGLIDKPGGGLHVWIGWSVIGLLAIRFAWGVLGPAEARFSAFPPDPRGALSHLVDLLRGRPREYASHNPAGAIMAYALWACLVVVTATGLVMTEGKSPVTISEERAAVAAGDWSALVTEGDAAEDRGDGAFREIAGDVHAVVANLMLVLALVHVAGVAVESRALGRNLVRPMTTGRGRDR